MTTQFNSNNYSLLLEKNSYNYVVNFDERNFIDQTIYQDRRRKNNISVRKSRAKRKCEMQKVKEELRSLTEERERLLLRLNAVKSNHDVLKDLYAEAIKMTKI